MLRRSFSRRSSTNSNGMSLRSSWRSATVEAAAASRTTDAGEVIADPNAAAAAAMDEFNMAAIAAENSDSAPDELRRSFRRNKQNEILNKNPKMKEIRAKEAEETRKDEGKKYRQLLLETQEDLFIHYPPYEAPKYTYGVREAHTRDHVVQPKHDNNYANYDMPPNRNTLPSPPISPNRNTLPSSSMSPNRNTLPSPSMSPNRNTLPPPPVSQNRNTLPPPPISSPPSPRRPPSQETVLTRQNRQFIDVAPGVQLPLRGADETWKAIEKDLFVPVQCFGCSDMIFCIQDASHVVCPLCKTVSPLNTTASSASGESKGEGYGVGLGFTVTELSRWQEQIVRERHNRRASCPMATACQPFSSREYPTMDTSLSCNY